MWIRPQGYATIFSPENGRATFDKFQCETVGVGLNEYDTTSCFHCNRVTHIKAKMDPAEIGGLCKICMKMICKYCVGKECVPFQKKLEQMEHRDYVRRQYEMCSQY